MLAFYVYAFCESTSYLPWFMWMKSIPLKPLYLIVCLFLERRINWFRGCNWCWSICANVIAGVIYVELFFFVVEEKKKLKTQVLMFFFLCKKDNVNYSITKMQEGILQRRRKRFWAIQKRFSFCNVETAIKSVKKCNCSGNLVKRLDKALWNCSFLYICKVKSRNLIRYELVTPTNFTKTWIEACSFIKKYLIHK